MLRSSDWLLRPALSVPDSTVNPEAVRHLCWSSLTTSSASPFPAPVTITPPVRGWCNRQHGRFWPCNWGFESSPPSCERPEGRSFRDRLVSDADDILEARGHPSITENLQLLGRQAAPDPARQIESGAPERHVGLRVFPEDHGVAAC